MTARQTVNISDLGDCQTWLSAFCEGQPAVASGVVVERTGDSLQPRAVYPDSPGSLDTLSSVIDQSFEDGEAIIVDLPQTSPSKPNFAVSYLISDESRIRWGVALAVNVADEDALKTLLQYLKASASWFHHYQLAESQRGFDERQHQLSAAVDFYGKVLDQESFSASSLSLVSELAIQFNCSLVAMGIVEPQGVRVCHLSNSAQFGKQMNLIRRIEDAMNEAYDQKQSVNYPEDSTSTGSRPGVVSFAGRVLSQEHQSAVLAVPLFAQDDCFAVILFQRELIRPFESSEIAFAESLLSLAALSLKDKQLNSRPLVKKALAAGNEQLQRLLGPGYVARKLVAASLVILFLFAWFAEGDYRLSADAELVADKQRAIVAPFNGYIDEAPVRAGDVVTAGSLLVQLDKRELELERLRWISQKNRFESQYLEAMAGRDAASANIIQAQLDQAEAQLQLVNSQIERSTQRAPFDGLLLSGDLSQRLGGSVSLGEVLFEISPLNAYRVLLKIRESRISEVETGQVGVLHLSALPDTPFEYTVTKLTPQTVSENGATYFIAEAELHDAAEYLRPGMLGVGKTAIDRRNLVGIWTREMREWMRLLQWRFWG